MSDPTTTIAADTNPVAAVWFSLLGGKFRVRLHEPAPPGRRSGDVLDDAGNRIGDASDLIYGGRGFAVHTRPFGGFVPEEQIEFLPPLRKHPRRERRKPKPERRDPKLLTEVLAGLPGRTRR